MKISRATPKELEPFFAAASVRKAQGIIALDLRGKSSLADFAVIMSGRSSRQVSAIALAIERYLKDLGIKALGMEGSTEGQWVLLDYGNVIVHVFYESTRFFYDLEGLWPDAARYQPAIKQDPAEPEDEQDIK
jgi:ribosome-associated protein